MSDEIKNEVNETVEDITETAAEVSEAAEETAEAAAEASEAVEETAEAAAEISEAVEETAEAAAEVSETAEETAEAETERSFKNTVVNTVKKYRKGGLGVFRLKEHKPIYEIRPEDDITFRGYLSYRHLKIIAWMLIAVACYGTGLSIYASASHQVNNYETIAKILQFGKELSVPLLLIGSFATVLNGRGNYKKVLIVNGSVAGALILVYLFIFNRYIIRGGSAMLGGREAFDATMNAYLTGPDSPGYFTFNIFIDLTLCTLVMFFINYNPKKLFRGKMICLFRALVLLPIAYELGSIALKILASTQNITLPYWIFPFLTTKPPVSFLMFLFIARYFRVTKRKFLKHGKTNEDYEAYLTTNHNSFRFARYLVLTMFIFALIDIMLLLFISLAHYMSFAGEQTMEEARRSVEIVSGWGFGETTSMLLVSPLLLLFSYSKLHKNKIIDIFVPLAGVALIVLIYADSLFISICELMEELSQAEI
ncbi:MAG: hypothetical protein IKP47_04765 [Ruminococcus sp.]|nr:hypothetical protein [Ruminococcus sp.]